MSLQDYLELCRADPWFTPPPLSACSRPSANRNWSTPDSIRACRGIFSNKILKLYPAFRDFYGMEEVIENIVSYFRHAAQGLRRRSRSSTCSARWAGQVLARRKAQEPDRARALLRDQGLAENESPLGLFNAAEGPTSRGRLRHPAPLRRRHHEPVGGQAPARVRGDITRFRVVKLGPSVLRQIAVAKTEPGDENNQDISSLVGKIDIRKLEQYSQDDPDAYSYSGGLCLANRGLLEFVEMFKAPIKVLHPLLTATQEGNQGHRGLRRDSLRRHRDGALERVRVGRLQEQPQQRGLPSTASHVKVPYCLRVSDEVRIYEKLLAHSSLSEAPCAPTRSR